MIFVFLDLDYLTQYDALHMLIILAPDSLSLSLCMSACLSTYLPGIPFWPHTCYVAENDPELLIFRVVRQPKCAPTPALHGTGDEAQGFARARQEVYHLTASLAPRPHHASSHFHIFLVLF